MINEKVIICIIIYYILYSYFSKTNYNKLIDSKYKCNSKIKLKFIIYNLQRLPYLLRNINIDKIIKNYDVCILQEYFNDFFLRRNFYLDNLKKHYNIGGKNVISSKIIDSGLLNISEFKLNFIDFVNFNNNKSVDILANKGFLVSKLVICNKELFIINTHLQNFYKHEEYNCDIISHQLNIIDLYIRKHFFNKKKCNVNLLVLGDFNRNINDIKWTYKPKYKIISKNPTVWDDRDGLTPTSTPYQVKDNQHPYWSDGGFIWGDIKVSDVNTIILDKYTDHCGIEFNIII